MIDMRLIDDLSRRLSDALPAGLSEAGEDMQKHFRAVLSQTFERMDLVSREQFRAQSEVLERCRKKLEELECRLSELEPGSKKPG